MKIVFAAGGTGGHLKPPQHLADILEEDEVIFMAKGLQVNRNFASSQYLYKEIASSPVTKKNMIKAFFLIGKGILQSLLFFYRWKPDLVVGFGSHYSFPPLVAAFLCRKPIILFEPNVSLGKVNRFFAKYADVVAVQFATTKNKNTKTVSLFPWKPLIKIDSREARASLFLKKEVFTILVFGGSQGAKSINHVFCEVARLLRKENISFQVIHLTGKDTKIKEIYHSLKVDAFVSVFEKKMEPLFSAADIAICRAGALTLSELIFFELPSILIPWELSSENHQTKNALFMQEKIRGGRVLSQKKLNALFLKKSIMELMQCKKKMKKNIQQFKEERKKEGRKDLMHYIQQYRRNL